MVDSDVKYYENGVETDSSVKHRGRSFAVRFTGEGLSYAVMKLCSADSETVIAETEGMLTGDGCVFNIPELPAGLYTFCIESVSGTNGARSEAREFLVTDEQYGDIVIPNGIIYQIFPDRFARGKTVYSCPGTVLHENWSDRIGQYAEIPGDNVENNEFFGGSLCGIADKLGYLQSLGAEWLYLNPIFTAYSNHKYDTCDFLTVDPAFGGREALDALIAECHSRGMKLILDGVFNHVGRDSLYFDYKGKCGGAYLNPASPYREWFDIRPDGSYDCWWGLTNLPKTVKTRSYREFICNTVIPEYARAGIDGWRLDVVDEYDNSFLEQITAAVKRENPNAVIIGEVWEDPTRKVAYGERKSYFYGAALDSATNYPLRNAIIEYITTGNSDVMAEELGKQLRNYPREKLLCMMNMLGTHDTPRILSVLGCENPDSVRDLTGSALSVSRLSENERQMGIRRLKAAYLLLVCLPGIPTVYYGDEAGMEGWRDPFNRQTFPWEARDTELTAFFAEANALRASHRALVFGNTEIVQSNDGFFVVKRTYGKEELLCVCNMSGRYDYFVDPKYEPAGKGDNIVHDGETGVYLRKHTVD